MLGGARVSTNVAGASFESTLNSLGVQNDESALSDAAQFGRWAALAAAAGALWHRRGTAADDPHPPCAHCGPTGSYWHVRFGPLLDARWAQALLRIPSYGGVQELVEQRALLAISSHEGQPVIPVFQFGDDGQPYAWLAPVLRALADVDITGWKVATWLFTPNPELGGRSPLAWLNESADLEPVLAAAPNAPALRAASRAAVGL
jgi:hypothetical protein